MLSLRGLAATPARPRGVFRLFGSKEGLLGTLGPGHRPARGGCRGTARDGRSSRRPDRCGADVQALCARGPPRSSRSASGAPTRGVARLPFGRLERPCGAARAARAARRGRPGRWASVGEAVAPVPALSAKDWRRSTARHPLAPNPERFWRDAFSVLIAGFAEPAPGRRLRTADPTLRVVSRLIGRSLAPDAEDAPIEHAVPIVGNGNSTSP